ncbi:hypothetical protein KIW84_012616 [Lathyrus oleraceus]|uniref:Uncharacterized protein n=1 Tax=Pisum sativum TaxID=3888 RepID=A0A9D5GX07_PEA|nr:hypothetical protein KIW84_064112 [Pisum sativum]KAI5404350.1 hypothetical protein KIW84_051493 [Pisum sativum]KAI5444064.1 hypothetical protein KIW84_012616 [Pisum sativum]
MLISNDSYLVDYMQYGDEETDKYASKIQKWDYNNWIADQCGVPAMEEWRKQMYVATSKNRLTRPETYRDEWDDDDLVQQAEH